jgi:hypothetical protein
MDSADRTAGPDAVIAFDHVRDFVFEPPNLRVCDWQLERARQFEAKVLVLGVSVEFTRWWFENRCVGVRPEGTPQRPLCRSSAVFGWAPAKLNWPVSRAIRQAD